MSEFVSTGNAPGSDRSGETFGSGAIALLKAIKIGDPKKLKFSLPWLLLLAQGGQGPSPLTLEEVLKGVDRAFPKLVATRLEAEIARSKSQEKRGAFDPVFEIGSDFLRFNSSSSPGKASETTMSQTTVEVLDRSGAKFAIGARLNRGSVKSPASSTGSLGEYFVSAKIPLLRDRMTNAKSIAEQQALLGEPLADQIIREAQFNLFEKAGLAYWEWVGAGEKLKISQDVLRLALDRAEFIRERIRKGANAPIDQQEADAEVFRRQGALEKAERDLQKAEFKLQSYQWQEDGSPSMTAPSRLQLPALPDASSLADTEIESARNSALVDRPELLGIKISRDILTYDLMLARNDRRPALDLIIGPGIDLGDDAIGGTMKAGIFYTIPLRQNTADGRISQVKAKVQKLDLERTQFENTIRLEVSDAVSAVRQSERRVAAAKAELTASLNLEDGERIRFNEGIGTLFLINQRERNRAEAAMRLVDVKVELLQARIALQATAAQLTPANANGGAK